MLRKSLQRTPLLSSTLILFMFTMVLANISSRMFQPILPVYLEELGANVGQIGLFFTLGAIAPLIFQIIGGWLSDVLGRLQAVAIGSLAGLVGIIVYLLAPSWQWLLISTVTGAISGAFVGPSFQAFIAEQSTEQTRGRVYGITQTIFALVNIIGPPLGGMLVDRFDFRSMFLAAGGLYFAATIIRIIMAAASNRQKRDKAKPSLQALKISLLDMGGLLISGGIITWILIGDGIFDVAFTVSGQLQPLYLQNIGNLTLTQIGWLTSLSALVAMLLMTGGGWLSDKTSERVGICLGTLIVAGGLWSFIQSRSLAGFAAASALMGAGEALLGPAYNSLISKAVPANMRGVAFGLFHSSTGLVSLPAPYIGAQLWERFSPRTPFFVPFVICLVMLPFIWLKLKIPVKQQEPASSPAAE